MRRRDFIKGIAIAGGWPIVARAQQPMPVVGFLNSASPAGYARPLAAFRQGLSEIGYVDGRNVTIEYRWAEGHYDRVAALAADLVRRQVNVIAATSTPAALAVKAATKTIPIVFTGNFDPVAVGLVASLSRPGGNVTGVTSLNLETAPKRLELLHQLVPTAPVVPLLVNPTNPIAKNLMRDMEATASSLKVKLHVVKASTEREIDEVFATLAPLRAGGLVIGTDSFFNSQIEQLGALTLRHAVPTIYQLREFVVAGGLMAYGSNISDTYRSAGAYTGRILKGEKPANLPVIQATKVELIVNLKTAKSLGVTIPLPLLARADEVIE